MPVSAPPGLPLEIRPASLDDPAARALIAAVQQEYVSLYGGPDDAPIDATEFADGRGRFYLGWLGDDAVAMGGWRRHGSDHPETRWAGNAAEIKRMYVRPTHRGYGFARAVLAELEASAGSEGVDWLLLETGLAQPEAIALYRSAGYEDVPLFGYYAASELSVHLGKPLSQVAPTAPPVGGGAGGSWSGSDGIGGSWPGSGDSGSGSGAGPGNGDGAGAGPGGPGGPGVGPGVGPGGPGGVGTGSGSGPGSGFIGGTAGDG